MCGSRSLSSWCPCNTPHARTHARTHVRAYVCMYVCTNVCIFYINIYIHTQTHTQTHTRVCVCVCVCECVCVCIYIYKDESMEQLIPSIQLIETYTKIRLLCVFQIHSYRISIDWARRIFSTVNSPGCGGNVWDYCPAVSLNRLQEL